MKRTRIAGMIGGGLALALLMFAGASLSGRLSASDAEDDPDGESVAASLTPVTFTQVSETRANGQAMLRLSGVAEPGSTIALQDRGEPISQVRTTPQGVWSAMIDISGPGMAVEAVMSDMGPTDPLEPEAAGVTRIRGVETIFRIQNPAPMVGENEPARALIMVGAPGAPTMIVSSPFGGLPAAGPLSIGAVDYDDAGGVIFSGLSERAGRVRLYASDAAIGETRVGADGRWTYIASSVMPLGTYEVRAELLLGDADNPVLSVSFERLPPLPATDSDDGALSVSFSDDRWQIRRSLVGGGTQSTVIFSPERTSE
ncbi:hypothetical protein [uncultured Algimonas sp.]|uniref:hypothetical protein n=1 Tax=uncultured Algimonas sp. TaxID=1547920 RepID=UPI002605EE8B|nr:hypothetical protein [uncultured Algimonas sp.]